MFDLRVEHGQCGFLSGVTQFLAATHHGLRGFDRAFEQIQTLQPFFVLVPRHPHRLTGLVGEVLFFLRQVPLHLPGNVKYLCDFVVFWENGEVTFEDVKGFRTALYKGKKKLIQHHYPIEIIEI